VLRHLPRFEDPRILTGLNLADDAAVYQLTDELALIQTVDFFTPIVDDAYTYGLIAAANSLSDVYALGGQPLLALNIVTFPTKTLPLKVLEEILRGGAEKAQEAGVAIVGGHTMDGVEPAYGLAVTGTVDPQRLVLAQHARPGDVLILTKPLGTGVITTALKAGAAAAAHVDEAVHWMTRLNRTAAVAMTETGAHAATDITGFGLLGHLSAMARSSGSAAEIDLAAVPLLPGAATYAAEGYVPGGSHTNAQYVEDTVQWPSTVSETIKWLLLDPQTSGGLLIAVAPAAVSALQDRLVRAGDLAAVIGRMIEGSPGHIHIS
jgi:selenide,water dikinase